jgi:HPt (histidine-containing phosphotransfer) domain-containing protein
MHSMNAGGMSAGMARIRARFIDELRVRRARIIDLRTDLGTTSQTHDALKEIGQISHKIAGTAKTLGFPALGALAGEIDDAIDQRATSLDAPQPALLGQIDQIIADMDVADK